MRRGIGTAVAITDPLVKYQSLVSTGVYLPDPAQHRLALHLQKLYRHLKDYVPSPEYRARLRRVSQAVHAARAAAQDVDRDLHGAELAVPNHPIWRNPLFARLLGGGGNGAGGGGDAMALTRVLASHQAAAEADSPRGLFLSGEVGTGKSMLLDLLADGLPTRLKRRWHFNTFMLHALSRLEQFRREQEELGGSRHVHQGQHPAAVAAVSKSASKNAGAAIGNDDLLQYSVMWLAKEMVEASPILFLDEFQLPDRAAGKLLSGLMVAFFQLGGVLVASSNRVPEELERATGAVFTPPANGLIGKLFGGRGSGELYGATSDFAAFLEVLKARCDFVHIEGSRDWRRRDAKSEAIDKNVVDDSAASSFIRGLVFSGATAREGGPKSLHCDSQTQALDGPKSAMPSMYILNSTDDGVWDAAVTAVIPSSTDSNSIPWEPTTLVVYGRPVSVPKQHKGVTLWEFSGLVASFGPADYITLASNFHTFVVDGVPILPTTRKNEARRFITLLDALYEARCKLVIRAEAGPDDIFFPDTRPRKMNNQEPTLGGGEIMSASPDDATYSETIAEVYQDQLSPFRPNISTYSSGARTANYDPDQDSDFVLEDDGADGNKRKAGTPAAAVNFSDTGAFTGEDERFAYRRAASRLWELCGARWHARAGDGWWRPLPPAARHWEGGAASTPLGPRAHWAARTAGPAAGGEGVGPSLALDEPAGLGRFSAAELRRREGGS
ncbi:hypothetical protein RB597_003583 [Gaeumannomyces tritici]